MANKKTSAKSITKKKVQNQPTTKVEEKIIKEEVVKETSVSKKNIEKKNTSKKTIKIIFLILIAVCLVLFGLKIFKKKPEYKQKATYTESFFIRNNKGMYALFNDKGKKITDFKFDSVGTIVDHSTLVHNEKQGYAIISDTGKELVEFGKYNYISGFSGLYRVRSDKGYKLLNSEGKTIMEAESLEVSSYGDDYPFVVIDALNKITVMSYDGKTITTFNKNSSAKTPTVNHVEEFATVFYDGQNVLFNAKTKKVVAKFSDKQHYCISASTKNKKAHTLNSCASWFETLDKVGHIVIVNGKVNDLSKTCTAFNVFENTIVCAANDGNHFVNISKKKAEVGAKIGNKVAFIDNENYAIRDDAKDKVIFYKNGKKVKTMDANLSASGKMEKDYYVLYVDNFYEFYNKQGKKTIKTSFKYASSFDKNGLAKVSDNGKKFYLINEKGKSKTSKYNAINNYDIYYQVTNKNGDKGVINKNGKEIVPLKYSSITIRNIRDKYYAIALKDDKNYLYNLSNKKIVLESKDPITLSDHYIKKSGTKTTYYTLKGKKIYSE